jgi:GAF domain-containing protein
VGDGNDADFPSRAPGAFQQLGGVVLGEDSVEEILDLVVRLAATTVSAYSASITVARDGHAYTVNSSGRPALELDQVQYDTSTGPCLDALGGSQVETDLMVEGEHWPGLADAAAAFGIRYVLSTPLTDRDRTLGALNIYSQSASSYTDDQKQSARLFAQQAAVLLANAVTLMDTVEVSNQLRGALASREVIGEAKGILMQQQACTRDQAFDILRRASQRENRKVRDLAESLVLAVEARVRGGGEGSSP